ncbi:MAG: OB-fold nucleic acid binding domain-containing protein, partial [Gammaproteobacteria bacterium]
MSDRDENKLIAQRRQKLDALREQGEAFPNDFRRDSLAAQLHARHGALDNDELESIRVQVAGRMMTKRMMGKTNFADILDMSGRIQLFVRRDALPDGVYAAFKSWDMGDLVGASGVLYKTKTGELSVKVDSLRLLVKSLRPLPEKFHGLSDQEQRYRMRYVDLIVNEETRRTFRIRAAMI